jgi:ADP-heptose:LPS heptosyltransferase
MPIKISTMRSIDFWAGVPLCALATALLRIGKVFRRVAPRPVRRILFIELSEIGSTILAGPAMRKARDQLMAELFFVTFDVNSGSIALVGMVPPSNVFIIRSDSLAHLARDSVAFLAWARRNAIDAVIDLELFSRFSALLTGLCGANRTVGFYRFYNEGLYRGKMLTHQVAYNPHIHIAKGYIALVDALLSREVTVPYSKTLIADTELVFSIPPPNDVTLTTMLERTSLRAPGYDPQTNRLVLINPNSGDLLSQRRWSSARYSELITRILVEYKDVFILITGSAEDRNSAADLVANVGNNRCVSFAGETALSDLPSLYALSALMVTNDSGPAHIAAATNLPTIVLFGPETPKLYRPLGAARVLYAGLACSPCATAYNHRNTVCTDNVCMQSITVDVVFSEVKSVLSSSGPSREEMMSHDHHHALELDS